MDPRAPGDEPTQLSWADWVDDEPTEPWDDLMVPGLLSVDPHRSCFERGVHDVRDPQRRI